MAAATTDRGKPNAGQRKRPMANHHRLEVDLVGAAPMWGDDGIQLLFGNNATHRKGPAGKAGILSQFSKISSNWRLSGFS
jgi:hypothetical protein